jgi:hypothetical protein
MEGAFLTVMELIVAEAAISIAATLRFFFWTRKRAKQGMVDVGLLVLQLALYALSGPVIAVSVYRNSVDFVLLMQDAIVLLPLTAACVAQIAMVVCMRDMKSPGRW